MSRHTCNDCHLPIPAGQAVVRSVAFTQVRLHKHCAEMLGIERAQATDSHHISLRAS